MTMGGECVGWRFTTLGNEKAKNIPWKLELSVLNFSPILTLITSINRILEGENLQTEISHQTSQQDVTKSLDSSGPEYNCRLNVSEEMFVLSGKRFQTSV